MYYLCVILSHDVFLVFKGLNKERGLNYKIITWLNSIKNAKADSFFYIIYGLIYYVNFHNYSQIF